MVAPQEPVWPALPELQQPVVPVIAAPQQPVEQAGAAPQERPMPAMAALRQPVVPAMAAPKQPALSVMSARQRPVVPAMAALRRPVMSAMAALHHSAMAAQQQPAIPAVLAQRQPGVPAGAAPHLPYMPVRAVRRHPTAEARQAGEELHNVLPEVIELQARSVEVHKVLGRGGFGAVVSATLQLVHGASIRTAIKLTPYRAGSPTLANIRYELGMAGILQSHLDILSCQAWMVLGDGTNKLPLEALEAYQPCSADEVLVVMLLTEEMKKDLDTLVRSTLASRGPQERIDTEVSGLSSSCGGRGGLGLWVRGLQLVELGSMGFQTTSSKC